MKLHKPMCNFRRDDEAVAQAVAGAVSRNAATYLV